jgi:hypothetical protein
MRDQQMTGYGPKPVVGVTPEQRVTVHSRKVACDGKRQAGSAIRAFGCILKARCDLPLLFHHLCAGRRRWRGSWPLKMALPPQRRARMAKP